MTPVAASADPLDTTFAISSDNALHMQPRVPATPFLVSAIVDTSEWWHILFIFASRTTPFFLVPLFFFFILHHDTTRTNNTMVESARGLRATDTRTRDNANAFLSQ